MSPITNYFNADQAGFAHDLVLRISGGREGIIHPQLLESVIEFIQNDDYYPSFEEKLSHLVFSITQNHIFEDGNKRTAIVLGAFFLEINGYELIVGRFIIEMENIVLFVAQGRISNDVLLEINRDFLEHGEMSDTIKLKYIHILEDAQEQSPG